MTTELDVWHLGDVVYRMDMEKPVTVVKVCRDTVHPYIVVRTEDGRELGTEPSRVTRGPPQSLQMMEPPPLLNLGPNGTGGPTLSELKDAACEARHNMQVLRACPHRRPQADIERELAPVRELLRMRKLVKATHSDTRYLHNIKINTARRGVQIIEHKLKDARREADRHGRYYDRLFPDPTAANKQNECLTPRQFDEYVLKYCKQQMEGRSHLARALEARRTAGASATELENLEKAVVVKDAMLVDDHIDKRAAAATRRQAEGGLLRERVKEIEAELLATTEMASMEEKTAQWAATSHEMVETSRVIVDRLEAELFTPSATRFLALKKLYVASQNHCRLVGEAIPSLLDLPCI